MKIIVAALLAVLGSGCATAVPADDVADAAGEIEVAFACTNGESLSVRFVQDREVAILMRHGDRIELQQQPSGSGFIYSNGPNTIRGKGNALTVQIGRMVPIECSAAP